MSAGKTRRDDFDVVLSGFMNASFDKQLKVLTSQGWNDSYIFNQESINYVDYDHFITKDGLLFVSGGSVDPESERLDVALTYNFTSMKWKKLHPMRIPRSAHKCQSILHNLGNDRLVIHFINFRITIILRLRCLLSRLKSNQRLSDFNY